MFDSPEMLMHYTKLESCIEILKSKTLRLSDYKSLSDKNELFAYKEYLEPQLSTKQSKDNEELYSKTFELPSECELHLRSKLPTNIKKNCYVLVQNQKVELYYISQNRLPRALKINDIKKFQKKLNQIMGDMKSKLLSSIDLYNLITLNGGGVLPGFPVFILSFYNINQDIPDYEKKIQHGSFKMWDNFCRSNGGVAILFDKNCIKKHLELIFDGTSRVILENVNYGHCGDYGSEFIKAIKDQSIEVANNPNTIRSYIYLRLLTKNIGFSDEQESRVVLIDNEKRFCIHFNNGKEYINAHSALCEKCVKQIIIGPYQDQVLVEEQLTQMKKDTGMNNIIITKSE